MHTKRSSHHDKREIVDESIKEKQSNDRVGRYRKGSRRDLRKKKKYSESVVKGSEVVVAEGRTVAKKNKEIEKKGHRKRSVYGNWPAVDVF